MSGEFAAIVCEDIGTRLLQSMRILQQFVERHLPYATRRGVAGSFIFLRCLECFAGGTVMSQVEDSFVQ